MTTITIGRAIVEQALEALENAEDQLAKPYSTDASKAITALRAALAQPVPHGCHVDLEEGMEPDECVLDEGSPNKCIYARRLLREGKDKTACEYWKPIEVKR
jgi:hypothetical protein